MVGWLASGAGEVVRLGVYADLVYRQAGETISTDLNFIQFVTGLAPYLDELVVFGRLHPDPGVEAYALPRDGVRFAALPHYPRVTSPLSVLGTLPGARRAFEAELAGLDAVLLFGPHPLGLIFARSARRHGVAVVLGARQEYGPYIANRLPSRLWAWAVPVAYALEGAYRAAARRLPSVVVGERLGRRYGGGPAPVLAMGFSLVSLEDVAAPDSAAGRGWADGNVRLLTVGRVDSEKNPLLLVDILAGLRAHSPRWHLTVAGDGPLIDALWARAEEHGVDEALHLPGHVAYGHELHELYRASHAFLHVSLTEGLPQVLFEAAAAGLPIVATDVGGVGSALGDGSRGLLVPPRDAPAAVAALLRLDGDPSLRERLMAAGLEHAREGTMEIQHGRLIAFLHAAAARQTH